MFKVTYCIMVKINLKCVHRFFNIYQSIPHIHLRMFVPALFAFTCILTPYIRPTTFVPLALQIRQYLLSEVCLLYRLTKYRPTHKHLCHNLYFNNYPNCQC